MNNSLSTSWEHRQAFQPRLLASEQIIQHNFEVTFYSIDIQLDVFITDISIS
jgi:hypothetical protein